MMHVTMDLTSEAWGIVGGAFVLLVFGVFFAWNYRPKQPPGIKGHRHPTESAYELILPDSYIDSFGGVIQEAGGGMPPLMIITIIGGLGWWLGYMLIYWYR
jgi:hypothetical protein